MDFNNINDIIDTDDHGIEPIVYLASQFCFPSDVFEDIPDGIRYSIDKELVTFKEAISHPKQLGLQDNEKVDGRFVKKRRTYYEKGTVKEANWYHRYIVTPHHIADVKNPCHPKGIEFRRNFSVPYQIYETLLYLTLDNGWYDPNCKNATGDLCSDIRPLLLGALHTLLDNASEYACQTNTNISADVHRRFVIRWQENNLRLISSSMHIRFVVLVFVTVVFKKHVVDHATNNKLIIYIFNSTYSRSE